MLDLNDVDGKDWLEFDVLIYDGNHTNSSKYAGNLTNYLKWAETSINSLENIENSINFRK